MYEIAIRGDKPRPPDISPPLTILHAEGLARAILNRSSRVEGVCLFGSLAEYGIGYDADLVLTVSDEMFQEFIRQYRKLVAYGSPSLRFGIVCRLLPELQTILNGLGSPIWAHFKKITDRWPIDVFLFPPAWQQLAKEIDVMIPPGVSPGFVQRIAETARCFDKDAARFLPISGCSLARPARQTGEDATGA